MTTRAMLTCAMPIRTLMPAVAFAAMGPAFAADAQDAVTKAQADAAAIRIVDCGTPVRSHKRGICENHLDAADFAVIAPGVSWFYNWHFISKDVPAADLKIAFLPMAWGDRPEDLAGLSAYLDAGNTPPAVLAINEPNLKGQAFIPPQTTAELYAKVVAIAAAHHLPVVGPNMALGSAPGSSITAHDPVENKDVTYTWFGSFLKAFYSFAGPTANGGAVGVHSYKDIYELKWAVETAHKLNGGGQVWVTEFAQWGANPTAEREYMIKAVDFLERTPYVAGYAWFKERLDKNSSLSLLAPEAGKLTPLGETYLAIPGHEANVFYRIPGKLPAADFTTGEKSAVTAGSETDGPFAVAFEDKGYADYQLQVDHAGTYAVNLRATGAGKLTLQEDGADLASVTVADDAKDPVSATLTLKAGTQTLHVVADGKKMNLAWIQFAKP